MNPYRRRKNKYRTKKRKNKSWLGMLAAYLFFLFLVRYLFFLRLYGFTLDSGSGSDAIKAAASILLSEPAMSSDSNKLPSLESSALLLLLFWLERNDRADQL